MYDYITATKQHKVNSMAYDYYYDDRYDAPDFMDETDSEWWDTLALS